MEEKEKNEDGIVIEDSESITTYILPAEKLSGNEDNDDNGSAAYAYGESNAKPMPTESIPTPKPGIETTKTPSFIEATKDDVEVFGKVYQCLAALSLDSAMNINSLKEANILFVSLYEKYPDFNLMEYKYTKDITISKLLPFIRTMINKFKTYHMHAFEGYEQFKLAQIIIKLEVLLYKITAVIKTKVEQAKAEEVKEGDKINPLESLKLK